MVGSVDRVVVIGSGVDAPRLESQLRASDLSVTRLGESGSTVDAVVSELDRAAADGAGIAVVTSDADVSGPALDDVLADPRHTVRLLVDTSAQVPDTVTTSGFVTIAGRRVTAAATDAHAIARADGRSLGALTLPAAAVPDARAAIRAASDVEDRLDPFDLIVTALVRGGISVTVVPVQPLVGRRLSRPAVIDRSPGAVATGPAAAPGAPAPENDPARLSSREETDRRWRAASRADDGFYSTFALRPLSRRVSRRLNERGWTPNRVTAISALIGAAAAAGFATGTTAGLVLGAIALQASLVFDCSDGEIARFTRGYTTAGAWLDAATDRVKEYLALAGLAVGAARAGDDIWILATIAMAVQTVRHLQDFSFVRTVLAQWREPVVDRRPLAATAAHPAVTSGGRAVGETVLDPAAGRRDRLVFWVKRIVHLPIAERWLLLSAGALFGDPFLAVVLYLGADVVAWSWTTIGWIRRSVRSGSGVSVESRDVLRRYRDDGPLARLVTSWRSGDASTRRATFAWIAPPLVTVAEFASVIIATALVAPESGVWAFGWVAAVAWHRYDIVYRWRDWRERPSAVVTTAMLGWPIRTVAPAAAGVVATVTGAEVLLAVLAVGVAWFAIIDVAALVPVVRRLAREHVDATRER